MLGGKHIALLQSFFAAIGCGCSCTTAAESVDVSMTFNEIALARSVCHGTCPVYSVTIDRDGRVIYEGLHNVPATGKFTSQISQEDVKTLQAAFDDAEFLSLGESATSENVNYTCGSDLPSVTVRYSTNQGSKAFVFDENCRPKEALRELLEAELIIVNRLATEIDQITQKLDWSAGPQ